MESGVLAMSMTGVRFRGDYKESLRLLRGVVCLENRYYFCCSDTTYKRPVAVRR